MKVDDRLHDLHAIRGWAALFVVIAHAKWPFWSGGKAYLEKFPMHEWEWWQFPLFALDMLTSPATINVIVFFVLSGFFIARSISYKKYTPLFFYGDRVIRIYIPVLGAILVSVLALYLAHALNPELFTLADPPRDYNSYLIRAYDDLKLSWLGSAMLFLPTDSQVFFGMNYPMWSLFYEALFYLIVPFVLIIFRRYLFFVLAVVLYLVSFLVPTEWMSIGKFFLEYAIYFAFGLLFYEMVSSERICLSIRQILQKRTDSVIITSALLYISSIGIKLLEYDKISFVLVAVATLLIMIWLLYGKESRLYLRSKRLLVNPFSNFLGKISFSMYLVHVPLLALMYAIWTKISGKLIFYEHIYWIAVLLVIPFGYLFYLLFERPSLLLLGKYKQRFGRNRTNEKTSDEKSV